MKQENIRNFCIIAHIDHGKSTLADRILEYTGAIDKRELKSQMLDSMDLERERGITIKLNAVQLDFSKEGEKYQLNLIDTPGHVDFSYEVSRSLAACEGAILVVDATQGVEAQTLANLYLALDNNLTIIPVINKIDLPSADIDKVLTELENIGFSKDEVVLTSAKTGEGIPLLLDKIIDVIPSPKGDKKKPLKALIFDSLFDSYRGVITSIRIVDGEVRVGDIIKMMETGAIYDVVGLSINTPKEENVEVLGSGEVGYLYASIKSIEDVHVGDTITLKDNPCSERLAGYKPMKPTVYCGLYPIDANKFEDLREALSKLKLNDAALTYEPETSKALGFGFRCGFLGLLHMDVIEERVTREYGIDLIATSPSVVYEVVLTDKSKVIVDSPPLSEIVYDFFDRLKSCTKGYASFDYEVIGYKESNLVKMDILLNGEVVDALSVIVHKDFAYSRGRIVCEKLKEIIPRQLFEVPIQAAIYGHVIARETVKALRKDVLAKCYGGDVTRKKKLLEKQKEGKKRMKKIGSVDVPQEAFLSVLSSREN